MSSALRFDLTDPPYGVSDVEWGRDEPTRTGEVHDVLVLPPRRPTR